MASYAPDLTHQNIDLHGRLMRATAEQATMQQKMHGGDAECSMPAQSEASIRGLRQTDARRLAIAEDSQRVTETSFKQALL